MHEQDEEVFHALIEELQRDLHATAVEKGWWPKEPTPNFGEKIALMHSELSEALEAWRHENPPSDHIPEYSGVEEELVDVFIRMLDVCGYYELDFAGALFAKMAFNKTRAFKHGGKKF